MVFSVLYFLSILSIGLCRRDGSDIEALTNKEIADIESLGERDHGIALSRAFEGDGLPEGYFDKDTNDNNNFEPPLVSLSCKTRFS
jgi:hypothetical protein